MTRRLLTIFAIVSLLVLTVTSPAAAGRRWDKPAPEVSLDNGRGVCDSPTSTYQGHTNSSANVSRSGALATIDLDHTSLHLGFEPCYDVAGGEGDLLGGSFAFIGLYARSGDIGSCPAFSVNTCVIYFGVAMCHTGQPTEPCYREWVDQPERNIFIYMKGCGYQGYFWNLGQTDTSVALNFYLDTNGNFVFNVDGVTKKVISKNASWLSCWAPNGNRGAIYSFQRWDYHDSIGQWNGTGSRILGAQYGVYGQGWAYTNWGLGACQFQSSDGDCQLVSGTELRAQTQ